MARRRVCVVGAGIIGLSSAVCILEQCPGVEVTLLADKFSPHTTSDVSGGFWHPFYLNETPQHLLKDLVLGHRMCTQKELKLFQDDIRWGSFHTTFQLDVTLYLDWLMIRFKRNGGKVQQRLIKSLNELADHYDIVVNCTGLGSCKILKDESLISIRGQVIRYHAPWVKHFFFKMDPPGRETYIFPGSRNVVVGGTTQKNNWNTEFAEADFKDIRQRALDLVPSIRDAQVVSNQIGLRPARRKVRLEQETVTVNGKAFPVIHNYGHGGSGITTHWGCAQHTVTLVTQAMAMSKL